MKRRLCLSLVFLLLLSVLLFPVFPQFLRFRQNPEFLQSWNFPRLLAPFFIHYGDILFFLRKPVPIHRFHCKVEFSIFFNGFFLYNVKT